MFSALSKIIKYSMKESFKFGINFLIFFEIGN